MVKDHALQRALIRFGKDVAAHAGDGKDPSKIVLEDAEEQLLQLSQDRTRIGLTPLADTMEETLQRISELSMNQGEITGIPTGFRWLDRELSGLHPSDLVLLAARPSMGKTATFRMQILLVATGFPSCQIHAQGIRRRVG